jgi:hypothetical protein
MKTAIDQGQLDILTFFVSDPKRFAYIIDLSININSRYFNCVNIKRFFFLKIYLLIYF